MSERLCEILAGSGALNAAQIKTAQETQKKVGGSLSVILVKLRYISERKLVDILAEALNLAQLELKQLIVSPSVSALMDVEVLEQHMILPLHRTGSSLAVATADPLETGVGSEIKVLTGLNPTFQIAARSDIQKAIDFYCHSRPCKVLEEEEMNRRAVQDQQIGSEAAGPVAESSQTGKPLLQALIELLIEKKLITEEELSRRAAWHK